MKTGVGMEGDVEKCRKARGGKEENKYRGGTSDATFSSSLFVPLSKTSKTAIFGVRKSLGMD